MIFKFLISAFIMIAGGYFIQAADVSSDKCPVFTLNKDGTIKDSLEFYKSISKGTYENKYIVKVVGGLERLKNKPLPEPNGKISPKRGCIYQYTPAIESGLLKGHRNMMAIQSKDDCNKNRVCFKLELMSNFKPTRTAMDPVKAKLEKENKQLYEDNIVRYNKIVDTCNSSVKSGNPAEVEACKKELPGLSSLRVCIIVFGYDTQHSLREKLKELDSKVQDYGILNVREKCNNK